MAGDRVARRVARANKWHELVERAGGSEEGAHRLVRESPEWAQSYEEYSLGPFVFSDEARVPFVLDLMVAADQEAEAVEELEPLTGEPDLGGKPLPKLPALRGLKLFAEGASIRDVKKDAPFSSYTLANRVWTWHRSGAVRWNVRTEKFDVDPRFKLVSPSEDTVRLIRL